MEAINDSTKNIAKALDILKVIHGNDNDDQKGIDESIALLEEALSKLTNT